MACPTCLLLLSFSFEANRPKGKISTPLASFATSTSRPKELKSRKASHENKNLDCQSTAVIMSWFSTGLDTLTQLTEKVQQATEKVQQAIPIDKEMLAKLTLNTDEMKAERQKYGEEAKRKAEAKDMLAKMFPWETRDSERDILVEECKEAILALSSNDDTFFGPYEMPALPVKEEDEEENTEDDDDGIHVKPKESKKNRKPSEESLQKLAKLEPLPPLLGDFDLDAHVGLIDMLLKVDPQLVKIQSNLSGKQCLHTPRPFICLQTPRPFIFVANTCFPNPPPSQGAVTARKSFGIITFSTVPILDMRQA